MSSEARQQVYDEDAWELSETSEDSIPTRERIKADVHDVVVVGAGPAGVLATERLREQGLRVLLLEAGRSQNRAIPLTAEDDPRWRFQSIGGRCSWPRIHAVGGRSLIWGGWISRFPDTVFRDGGWPYGAATIAPHYASAERRLGVVRERLNLRYRNAAKSLGQQFMPRRGAHIGREIWTADRSSVAQTARTEAVALSLAIEGRRAGAVDVVDVNGRHAVKARAFVLAASAVETTRILLASGDRHPLLGRRLADHLVVSHLLVEPKTPSDYAGRTRFPPAALVPYGRFCIEIVGPRPLSDIDPNLLASLQLTPRRDKSATYLFGLGALAPHPDRYVDLAPRARDALGRAIPRIHLAWSDAERRLAREMEKACMEVAEAITSPGGDLIRYGDPFSSHLLFHPSGTCAMGRAEEFPCNPYGRLRNLDNVWIADASVFPSAGDRHPTLTVLAHTLRMSESVVSCLR